MPADCPFVEDGKKLAEEMQATDGGLIKYLSMWEVEQPGTFRAT